MAIGDLFEHDAGVEFLVTIKDQTGAVKDISAATATQYLFQKPDGSVLTVDASFKTDGTDGQLSYVTTNDDLDQIGLWKMQVYLVFNGNHKYSDIGRLRIRDAIPLGS